MRNTLVLSVRGSEPPPPPPLATPVDMLCSDAELLVMNGDPPPTTMRSVCDPERCISLCKLTRLPKLCERRSRRAHRVNIPEPAGSLALNNNMLSVYVSRQTRLSRNYDVTAQSQYKSIYILCSAELYQHGRSHMRSVIFIYHRTLLSIIILYT